MSLTELYPELSPERAGAPAHDRAAHSGEARGFRVYQTRSGTALNPVLSHTPVAQELQQTTERHAAVTREGLGRVATSAVQRATLEQQLVSLEAQELEASQMQLAQALVGSKP